MPTHPDLSPYSSYSGSSSLNLRWPSLRKSLEQAYPSVDIDRSLRESHCWLVANPHRAKKRLGAFLMNWVKRSEKDSGRREAPTDLLKSYHAEAKYREM